MSLVSSSRSSMRQSHQGALRALASAPRSIHTWNHENHRVREGVRVVTAERSAVFVEKHILTERSTLTHQPTHRTHLEVRMAKKHVVQSETDKSCIIYFSASTLRRGTIHCFPCVSIPSSSLRARGVVAHTPESIDQYTIFIIFFPGKSHFVSSFFSRVNPFLPPPSPPKPPTKPRERR